MSPFNLAVLNLSRRKVPSLIAILSIAISVACSGILLRLNRLSENRFSMIGRGGDAIVGAKAGGIEILLGALNGEGDYPGFLPRKLFDSLKAEQTIRFEDGTKSKTSFIRSIVPLVLFAKLRDFRVLGTDESFLVRPDTQDSVSLANGQWASGVNETIVGSTVASVEGLKVGDTVSVQSWTALAMPKTTMITLRISGVLASTSSAWDRMLFSNLETAGAVLAHADLEHSSVWGSGVLNYFLIYLEPGGFEPLASLVNRRTVGQAVLVSDQKMKLLNLTNSGKNIGLFVTILILLLGGLSVGSMLVTRFDAMALQLAVLRAIGYKKNVIARWLLWEGFLMGVIACFAGAIFDLIGFPLLRDLLGDVFPSAEIVRSSILQSFPIWITAIAATTVSVIVPLYRVYRQDVHFSLRS